MSEVTVNARRAVVSSSTRDLRRENHGITALVKCSAVVEVEGRVAVVAV